MVNRPRVGIAVVVVKGDLVLLGKRKNAHGEGEWATPGGHLENLETPEDCVYRELLEETGLKAQAIHPGPWTNNFFADEKHYLTLFMFVNEFSGTPSPLEPHKCEKWEWFAWDKLPQPLFATVRSFVDKIGVENLQKQSFIQRSKSQT